MVELAGQATFICGHPKSGTSLLMTLLDSHPQLLVYPEETAYFRRFSQVTSGMTLTQKIEESDRHLLHIFEWDAANPPASQAGFPDRDYTAFSCDDIRKSYRRWMENLGHEESSLLPAAMLAYGEISSKLTESTKRWVEKTPYNEKFVGQIFSLWPDARCIHVIRDPRDNFTSYRRKHPDWTPWVFAASWRGSTLLAEQNQRRYGDTKYLVLRFEDLLSESEMVLGQIRNFLEIEDDEILRKPTRAGRQWGGNSMFGDQFARVSKAPLGRWKESLDDRSLAEVEAALERIMRRWNYVPESRVRPTDRFLWLVFLLRRRMAALWKSSPKGQVNHLGNKED